MHPRLSSLGQNDAELAPRGGRGASPHQAHRRPHLSRRERVAWARGTDLQPPLPAKHISRSTHGAGAPRPDSRPRRRAGWLAFAPRIRVARRERAAVARSSRRVPRHLRRCSIFARPIGRTYPHCKTRASPPSPRHAPSLSRSYSAAGLALPYNTRHQSPVSLPKAKTGHGALIPSLPRR
jgi:hypothetical protein